MTCRRCSECEGRLHHWIEDPLDPADEDFEPGDYCCKHCEVRGEECPNCVDGIALCDCEFASQVCECPQCEWCKGEAVVPMSDQDYDQAMHDSIQAFKRKES
jgi:hypothetical protein